MSELDDLKDLVNHNQNYNLEAHDLFEQALENERTMRIEGDAAGIVAVNVLGGSLTSTNAQLAEEALLRAHGDLTSDGLYTDLSTRFIAEWGSVNDSLVNVQGTVQSNYNQLNGKIDDVENSLNFVNYSLTEKINRDNAANLAAVAKLQEAVDEYVTLLQDITLDSTQITLDNGEINAGAWTILSQAREWDLAIIRSMKDYQASTDASINEALEEIQGQLPNQQEIINNAIEELSKSQIILDLDKKISDNVTGIDTVNKGLINEVIARQDAIVDASNKSAEELAAKSAELAQSITAESQNRINAVEREATIRAEQLRQEALDRTEEIDEKIRDITIDIDADLTAVNKRIDDAETHITELNTKLDTDIAAVNKRVTDANTKVDSIKTETDAKIATLTATSNQLVVDLKAEEAARIADIKALNDGLTAEIRFRKDGDQANVTALNNYKASNDAALANVRTELAANVTATEANTRLITALDTRLTTNEAVAASAVQKAETALTETSALATQMQSVTASIGEIETELGNKADAAAVQQLSAKVDTVDGKVTANTNALTVLRGDLTTLDGKVTGNASAISELKTTQITQGNQITQLTEDTTLLKNTVTDLQDEMTSKVDATAFNQLSTKVDKNASDITSQGQAITRLDNEIVVMNGKINNKAEASALQALDTKVSTIDGKVTANSTAITKLEGRITVAEGDIKKKLDASVIDNYSTTVETNKAIADRITSYDAGLLIGGQNFWYLANRGSNDIGSAATVTFVTPDMQHQRLTITVQKDGKFSNLWQNVKVTEAGPIDVTKKASVSFSILSPYPWIRVYAYVWNMSNPVVELKVAVTPNKWHRVALEGLTANSNNPVDNHTGLLGIRYYAADMGVPAADLVGKVFEIKDVQCQYGTKATEYEKPTGLVIRGAEATAKAVQQIQAQVTEHEGKITSNSNAITTLNNRVTVAEGEISKKADASAVNSLSSRVETAEGKISSQGTAITKLTNDLSATNQTLSTKADSSVVSALDSKVTAQGNTIVSQGTQITELKQGLDAIDLELDGKANSAALQTLDSKVTQQGSTIASQGTAITNLTNRVTTVEGDVAKKADASALNSLTTKVDTIDGKVTTQGTAITKLQNDLVATNAAVSTKAESSAVQALDSKVTQQGNTITSNSNAITKLTNDLITTNSKVDTKADASAVTALTNRVTATEAGIVANNTLVTKLEAKVDSQSTTSLTADPLMALPDAWISHYGYNMAQYFKTVTDGKIANTVFRKDTSNLTTCWNYSKSTVPNNRKYRLTMYVRRTKDSSGNMYFTVRYVDNQGRPQAYSHKAVAPVPDTNVWTKVTAIMDFTAVAEAASLAFGFAIGHTGAVGTWEMQDFRTAEVISAEDTDSSFASAAALQTLDNKVTQQGKDITSNSSAITKLTNDLATTNAAVNTKADAAALSALDTKVTTIDGKVTSQGTQITSLTNKVDVIEGELSKKADATALQSLDSKVAQQGNTITSQGTAITDLTSRVTKTEGDISKKADASALNSLDTKVTAIDGKVTSQGNSITQLQNSVTTINTELSKKADASALNSYYTKVEADSATAGSISKFNASLRVGTENLLIKSRWVTPAFANVNTADKYEFKLVKAAAPYTVWAQFGPWPADVMQPNDPVVLSFRIKALDDTPLTVGGHLTGMSGGLAKGITVSLDGVIVEGAYFSEGTNVVIPNDSKYHLVTVVVKNKSATNADYVYIQPNRGTSYNQPVNCSIKEVMISVGNTYVEWQQPYEVVKDAIAANTTAVSSLDTRVKSAENTIILQGNSVTKLQADLTQTNKTATDAELLGKYQGQGKLLYDDPTFKVGTNSVANYGVDAAVVTPLERVTRSADNPTNSGYELTRSFIGTPNLGFIGYYPVNLAAKANKVYLQKMIMKIPLGYYFLGGSNAVGTGGDAFKVIGSNKGTGDFQVYYRLIQCGTSGSFSTTGHIYFRRTTEAPVATPENPAHVVLAQMAIFDVTDAPDAVPQDLWDKVNANASAIQTLDNKVTQQGKDIASVSTAQTVLANRVTVVEGGLSSKAEASAVQQLDSRVTAVDGRVTSNTSAITNLTGRVTTVESGLATKADASALNNYYTKVDADKAIAGQISNYDATLVIGGTNIQSNSNEVVHSNNSTSFAEMQYVKGTPNKIINKSNKGKVSTYTLSFFTAEVGKTYTASVRVKPSIDTQLNFASSTTSQWERVKEGPSNCLKDVWTTLWFTFTARTTSIRLSGFHRESGFANDVVVEYRDYQVEEGNKVTAWSPSYVDINKAITTNASAIQTTNTEVSRINGVVVSQGTQITNLNSSLTTTNNNVTAAQTAANNAMAAAGEKGKVIYGSTAPAVADRLPQNLWIDTTGNANTPKRWNGTTWAAVTDKVATDAAVAAAAAQATANTKADASAVTSLEARTTAAEGNITSLSTQTTSLSNRITAAEGKITANTNALSTLDSKVTTINGKVTAQGTSITKVEASITGLEKITTTQDTRNDNQPPSWYWANYARKTVTEFKLTSVMGLSSLILDNYVTVETSVPWPDASGGVIQQVATNGDGSLNCYRKSGGSGATATWGTWSQPVKALSNALGAKADASAVSSLDAKVTSIDGRVTATSNSLVQLETKVNGNTAQIAIQAQTIDGIKAEYAVRLDVNGLVVGFGLINDGTTTAFGINADRFYVGKESNGKKPFMVLTSSQTINGVTYPAGTWIDVALIANATIGTAHIADAAITTAKIKDLAVDNAKIKDLHGDKITANSISGDKIKAKSITADKMEVDELSAVSGNLGRLVTYKDPAFPNKARMIIEGSIIMVYDDNNILRVRLGLW